MSCTTWKKILKLDCEDMAVNVEMYEPPVLQFIIPGADMDVVVNYEPFTSIV